MVGNRICAVVLLALCVLFALAQLVGPGLPAMAGVVGTPLLLLGPGWAVMRFFVPGLGLFEAVVAVAISLAVWTLMALLLLEVHLWQPLAATDAVLAVVAVIALLALRRNREVRPA